MPFEKKHKNSGNGSRILDQKNLDGLKAKQSKQDWGSQRLLLNVRCFIKGHWSGLLWRVQQCFFMIRPL